MAKKVSHDPDLSFDMPTILQKQIEALAKLEERPFGDVVISLLFSGMGERLSRKEMLGGMWAQRVRNIK